MKTRIYAAPAVKGLNILLIFCNVFCVQGRRRILPQIPLEKSPDHTPDSLSPSNTADTITPLSPTSPTGGKIIQVTYTALLPYIYLYHNTQEERL